MKLEQEGMEANPPKKVFMDAVNARLREFETDNLLPPKVIVGMREHADLKTGFGDGDKETIEEYGRYFAETHLNAFKRIRAKIEEAKIQARSLVETPTDKAETSAGALDTRAEDKVTVDSLLRDFAANVETRSISDFEQKLESWWDNLEGFY